MKRNYIVFVVVVFLAGGAKPSLLAKTGGWRPAVDKVAAKPLYRDPVMDGAADPTVIWSPRHHKWYMFYTSRRANVPGLPDGVAWAHGTPIGIATSGDGGANWTYLRNANIIYKDAVVDKTYWAPAVVEHNSVFHMYLSYVPGVFKDWNHPRHIIHLTSEDLINWQYESTLPLSDPKVIDPCLLHLPDGTWRMWYKDAATGGKCNYADSPDLYNWTDHGEVVGLSDVSGEGPNAFHWQGHYWLLRDIWKGLALYRSDDALAWTRVGTLLQDHGTGPDDSGLGGHPDVILSGGRAYLFYMVQIAGGNGRRTCIQVVELKYDAAQNTLTADRNIPTHISLQPPADVETQSKFE